MNNWWQLVGVARQVGDDDQPISAVHAAKASVSSALKVIKFEQNHALPDEFESGEHPHCQHNSHRLVRLFSNWGYGRGAKSA